MSNFAGAFLPDLVEVEIILLNDLMSLSGNGDKKLLLVFFDNSLDFSNVLNQFKGFKSVMVVGISEKISDDEIAKYIIQGASAFLSANEFLAKYDIMLGSLKKYGCYLSERSVKSLAMFARNKGKIFTKLSISG